MNSQFSTESSNAESVLSDAISDTTKKVSKMSKGFFENVQSMFSGSKGLWMLAFVLLVGTIVYYLYTKSKKALKEGLEHSESDQQQLENRELQLPEQYLADSNGNPVILTPEIVQQIRNQNGQTVEPSNNLNTDENMDNTDNDDNDDNMELLDESEDENVSNQDLTTDEMADIREQLEMMNNTNVMASNF